MKVAIYFIAAFFMLENLGALDVSLEKKQGQIKTPKYEISVSKFDFAKQDKIMPGVTLLINDSISKKSKIEFTLARNLSTYDGKEIFTRLTPVETAIYAKLSYRF